MISPFMRAGCISALVMLAAASMPGAALESALAQADLVVRGKVGREGIVILDLQTIMSFPPTTFRTIDPWDKEQKEHSFTGVLLKDLLARLGIRDDAKVLVLTAKNNYTIPVERKDYEEHGSIIAWMMDGKLLATDPALRKRGPLAVAIDFAGNKDLPVEIYKHQLIWQLADILV